MKKIFVVLIVSGLLMLTACSQESAWDKMEKAANKLGLTEGNEYSETDNVKEELGSLSSDEKRILSRGGFYAKDRIYAGKLYGNEIQKVKNIRGAKDYLAKKYPNHEFKITLYQSRGKQSNSPTGDIGNDLIWVDIDGENTDTWVEVIESDNGIEFGDNIASYLDRHK